MTSDRVEHIALIEAAYRIANDRMAAWEEVPDDEAALYLCECGDAECDQRIPLVRSEYEAVRADSARFAIVCGHELPDVETLIESRPDYCVIEKPPTVARILTEADPRTAADGPARQAAEDLAARIRQGGD